MNIVSKTLNILSATNMIISLDRSVLFTTNERTHKIFENEGKNMSFVIENHSVLTKYIEN